LQLKSKLVEDSFWLDYITNDLENLIYRIEDYALVVVGGLIGGYASRHKFNLKKKLIRLFSIFTKS